MGQTRSEQTIFNIRGKVGPSRAETLIQLDAPITAQEVLQAIKQMPKYKACGPDGMPTEFYQKFWEIIQGDLMELITAFFNGTCNIKCINRAAITLVSKKEGAVALGDFRPISVVNTVIKIISKIMATRLQLEMKKLVSTKQTAFIKGRSIMESFVVARELMIYSHKNKIPSILYKVDFAKAFDTVDWTFLTNLLIERGFPPIWLSAMVSTLHTSHSAVMVNGQLTRYFEHKWGLRQGDPLSPLLFVLVADSLQWFLDSTRQAMNNRMVIEPQGIQFADDTIIYAEAHPLTLRVISLILKLYADLTGLKINKDKSGYIPISIPQTLTTAITAILGSQTLSLPIKYLGLPLTRTKPRIADFNGIINIIQQKMEGWKSNLLSFGGRLTIVKAVLTAIRLHHMQTIRLPKGVVQQIDRLRRKFLWKGNKTCRGIICLVNWERVCALKSNGGMGVINLSVQNETLLAKWLWKIVAQQEGHWPQIIQKLYGISNINQITDHKGESFFLDDIRTLVPLLNYSVQQSTPTGTPEWRLTAQGTFTCALAYQVMHDSGMRCEFYKVQWKLKVPQKVAIFVWLLIQDRILTQQVMEIRGITVVPRCVMCQLDRLEDRDHLM